MKNVDLIKKFIQDGYECNYLDFKKTQYCKKNFSDLIVDIMSMANSDYYGDKYIITGVKDRLQEEREVIGIDEHDIMDDAVYQNLIHDNIEPLIKFEYYTIKFDDKILGIFKISNINEDKPYMMKKKYGNLSEGLCKVRRGSRNSISTRKDIDGFYFNKEKVEIKFMEASIWATYVEIGCASILVTVRNYSRLPLVITAGWLSVFNSCEDKLTEHRVYGFDDKKMGADFKLTLAPMDEKYGNLFVGFTSNDCLRLGLDQYGYTEEKFNFELVFIDTEDNEYKAYVREGGVFAKGDFLWKVQLATKKKEQEAKGSGLFRKIFK